MSRNTNNWMANERRANFQLPYVGKRGVSLELREGKNVEVIGHEHISEVINTVMGKTEKGVGISGEAQILKEKLENAIHEVEGFKGSSAKAVDEFLVT